MKEIIKPVFSCGSSTVAGTTTFFCLTKEIQLNIDEDLLIHLRVLCDGFNNIDFIINHLPYSKRKINSAIQVLLEYGILVDSSSALIHFQELEKNPQLFGPYLNSDEVENYSIGARKRHEEFSGILTRYSPDNFNSEFGSILKKRISVRKFKEIPISLQSLVNMIWTAYGASSLVAQNSEEVAPFRKTVPSAGALYPLNIYLALNLNVEHLKRGFYRAHFDNDGSIIFERLDGDYKKIELSLIDPIVGWNSMGTLIIAGSYELAAKKYGSRAVRYTILEAGHVAQNFHLGAVSENIQTVEVGGFYDNLLKESFGMPDDFNPITSIIFGAKDELSELDPASDFEIQWVPSFAGNYQSDLFIATARFKNDKDGLWSTGRALNSKDAFIKAISEAREWRASSFVSDTFKSTYSSLTNAVDPRIMASYRAKQFSKGDFPFKKFDELIEYDWATGHDLISGKRMSILADFIFFPFKHKFQYFFGNTSGTAAYFNKDGAIQNAVLEIIERDAFMIHHLIKPEVKKVRQDSLPEDILKRIRKLEKEGFVVSVYDYTLDLTPVVFCHIISDEYTFSTCSACADFDIAKALDHALMESETSVLHRLRFSYNKTIRPQDVSSPEDHALLYSQKGFYKKSKPNVSGEIDFNKLGADVSKNWEELLQCFKMKGYNVIIHTMKTDPRTAEHDEEHFIVRALVPGLIPLTFGYNSEPYGLPRIYEMGSRLLGKTITFSDLNRMPHPYN